VQSNNLKQAEKKPLCLWKCRIYGYLDNGDEAYSSIMVQSIENP
jgi:hypothetical protein